ncbi:von Willebrand factor A domain-containing protein 7-like isoform X2 [Argopecten irradians]|uniref:von Willebrand factor A domain-containing protein 7-like isoform X2 n=1 Tax=Argopecten irradians TaxID=31199 RepID=UPI0037173BFB
MVISERIRDADAVVKSTRLEIAAILSEGRLSDASVGQLIDKVGTCLMVLQSFYSNTNWVEMMVNGGESFLNFGTLTPFNLSVAESGTDTCRNCDDRFANGCKNNLLVHDRLTSGYLYGQLYYPKPVANPRATEGKCSHGGPDDTGKNNTATGGINKETPDWTRSPHAHLHNMAGLTAVRATESFFMDKVTGLLKDVSRDVVQEIFKLNRTERQVPYLGLALDISASMVTDISSLKHEIVGILSAVMGTDNAPGKYVLSTFAGQANLTNVVTTTDPNEFIRLLNGLTFVPKTSCPTYVMSGIRAAIKACTPHSTVYVATDVDAKDNNLMSTVMEEATEKHISLKFLLTGSCS